jgi:hypothetical protein
LFLARIARYLACAARAPSGDCSSRRLPGTTFR